MSLAAFCWSFAFMLSNFLTTSPRSLTAFWNSPLVMSFWTLPTGVLSSAGLPTLSRKSFSSFWAVAYFCPP